MQYGIKLNGYFLVIAMAAMTYASHIINLPLFSKFFFWVGAVYSMGLIAATIYVSVHNAINE